MTASPISDLNPLLLASGSRLTVISKGDMINENSIPDMLAYSHCSELTPSQSNLHFIIVWL